MEIEIQNFNEAATELQQTEFRIPRTPGEWQRMRMNPPKREYAKLFGAVSPFIEAYTSAKSGERSSVAARLSADALGTLRTFAYSTALVSVRRNSPPLIAQGLAALAILGEIDDPRDLLFYLATLRYSALKLGVDAQALFAEVALLCSGPFRDWMQGFPLLPSPANDLSAFKLRETTTTEGFDIVQDPT